jgi:hypothetical protein
VTRDVDWERFVADARTDVFKDAVLGGSALPRWLLRQMLRRPRATGVALGLVAAAFGLTDTPVDWWFVSGLGIAVAGACTAAGVVLRRRVRRYLRSS